ncbi:Ser-Thr-rich glycosyl-phosphatidyl-inositol-anchored membrane family-domain-containing protein [Dipodascopsis tothii]|uniref:Ser-Thr-rich glycosyl-phosphatidyl-inositol-anchored membrane family-domain-containing protein n=1 Tax=Dipodascopsis tothii TaxID=44089 RepID=UPI0034CF78B2
MRRGLQAFVAAGLLLATHVYADIEFLTPKASKAYDAADALAITWQDSGDAPSMDDLTTTTIILCTGSNDDITALQTLVNGVTLSTLEDVYDATIDTTVATDGEFFLQMTSIISTGGYVINYSDRFNLTGMTGTTEAEDGGDTSAPSRQISGYTSGTTAAATATGTLVATTTSGGSWDPYTVPYSSQDGWLWKFAPMQPQPKTSINPKASMTRRYPKTSYSVFKTNTMVPYATTTATLGWSYTPTTTLNHAVTASNPYSYSNYYTKPRSRWVD